MPRLLTSPTILMILMVAASRLLAAQQAAAPACKVEVVSVRALSSKENEERSGPDSFVMGGVAVRVRLECKDRALLLAYDGGVQPLHYVVNVTDAGILWPKKIGDSTGQYLSPGVEALTTLIPTHWITIPEHSPFEWDDLDNSFSQGDTHAMVAFVRLGKDQQPIELISNSYLLPRPDAPIGRIAGPAQDQIKCTRDWQGPEIHGLRLGMTVSQVKARVPFAKIAPADSYGVRLWHVYPFPGPIEKTRFPRVFEIDLIFYRNRLVHYAISYFGPKSPKAVEHFVGKVSNALRLPESTKWSREFQCGNIQVEVGKLRTRKVTLRDLLAEPILDARVEQSWK